MKRLAIAALAVLALGAVIAGAQVVPNPQIPPNTVCAYNTSTQTLTSGQASWLQCDSAGNVKTSASSAPVTTGGLSTYFVQPTASDNHVVIKNGAGQVYYVMVFNNSATVNYVRLYDAGTGFNGCNSATGLITQMQVPASVSVGGAMIPIDAGASFATGISICITSGYATTDVTNATASAMSITVGYK